MKAIVRKAFGGPEVLEVVDVPEPAVRPGCILIRVRAFGLNRAELYMRRNCGERWPTLAASNVLGRCCGCDGCSLRRSDGDGINGRDGPNDQRQLC